MAPPQGLCAWRPRALRQVDEAWHSFFTHEESSLDFANAWGEKGRKSRLVRFCVRPQRSKGRFRVLDAGEVNDENIAAAVEASEGAGGAPCRCVRLCTLGTYVPS